jgi:hypothetical protein
VEVFWPALVFGVVLIVAGAVMWSRAAAVSSALSSSRMRSVGSASTGVRVAAVGWIVLGAVGLLWAFL